MKEIRNKFRVLVDSNVLVSALISENSPCRQLMQVLIHDHHLILSTYSINEVSRVLKNKFPSKITEWDYMLTNLDCELVYTPGDLLTSPSWMPPIFETQKIFPF